MSQETEKLKKELNKNGKALLGAVSDILAMKSYAKYFPYVPNGDTLHLGIKGNRLSIQGKQDSRIYAYFVVDGDGVTLVPSTGAPKVLSATRAKDIHRGLNGIISLFTFYNVKPFEIALEVNGDKVAMVANTSQGRVTIIG